MSMTPELLETMHELLDGAIARIGRGWCRCTMARNAKGEPESRRSARACQWCMEGAMGASLDDILDAASSGIVPIQAMYMACKAVQSRIGTTMVKFNDRPGRTQQEVLDVLIATRKSMTPPEEDK